MKYPVVEIFDSIQGEGSWMGRPVTFIRLGGCNLACPWCDTDFSKFDRIEDHAIVKRCGNRDVVITGGEPTIHDLMDLLVLLKLPVVRNGVAVMRQVAIETNGTNSLKTYRNLIDWVVCSPKPQSEWKIHPECCPDELKYIVDGLWKPEQVDLSVAEKCKGRIWLHPEASQMDLRWKEAFEYAMENDMFRVGCQLHKFINVQ